jgi:hypothetical protein
MSIKYKYINKLYIYYVLRLQSYKVTNYFRLHRDLEKSGENGSPILSLLSPRRLQPKIFVTGIFRQCKHMKQHYINGLQRSPRVTSRLQNVADDITKLLGQAKRYSISIG